MGGVPKIPTDISDSWFLVSTNRRMLSVSSHARIILFVDTRYIEKESFNL